MTTDFFLLNNSFSFWQGPIKFIFVGKFLIYKISYDEIKIYSIICHCSNVCLSKL